MNSNEICFFSSVELRELIRKRAISVKEVMEAHLSQIERLNPKVNAIVTLLADKAMENAFEADRALAKGNAQGCLFGLPLGVKDLILTKGIRTTYGSRIYKDFVPENDALIVEREKAAGAIIVGKTNTPEFGAGYNTYNEVFGETLNPYDLSKTCGGSSGGSAVALACGMLSLADGSDFGGSLRNPASYCNVVGFRPSPGRIPVWPNRLGWWTISVEGPMARRVQDIALFLSAIAGPDPRSPISIEEPGSIFSRPLERDFKGTRIAWSRNLGFLPVAPVINRVCDMQRSVFEDLGCNVEDAHPDLSDASEVFSCLRAWRFALDYGDEVKRYRHLMMDEVISNTEEGFKLDGISIAQAEAKRTEIYHRIREFMERYSYLIFPVSAVPPYSAGKKSVTEIEGVEMGKYFEGRALRHSISITGLPAISVPCGFTPDGLPVGLQIVSRHNSDFEVLQLAHAFEQATKFYERRPPLVDPTNPL